MMNFQTAVLLLTKWVWLYETDRHLGSLTITIQLFTSVGSLSICDCVFVL